MVDFTDINRIPGFRRLLPSMLGRSLESNTKDAYDRMIRNWERGQDAQGNPWEPLAPETIARKGHSIPLIETRDMIDSAEYQIDEDELQAEIWIETEYAYVHEYGAPSKGIPPRPILKPTLNYFDDSVNSMVGKAIDRSMANAGAAGIGIQLAGNISGGRG